MPKCRKIGEGVYGEVFLNEGTKSSFVLKIIPIEGTREVNGSQQKRFDEILQEVIISQELSALRNDKELRSAGFVEVLSARCVEGRYPPYLCNLWKEYRDNRGTENDDPDEVFGDDQLYVVFELANCGFDLEAYKFKNAEQSYSIFKQVMYLLLYLIYLDVVFALFTLLFVVVIVIVVVVDVVIIIIIFFQFCDSFFFSIQIQILI